MAKTIDFYDIGDHLKKSPDYTYYIIILLLIAFIASSYYKYQTSIKFHKGIVALTIGIYLIVFYKHYMTIKSNKEYTDYKDWMKYLDQKNKSLDLIFRLCKICYVI